MEILKPILERLKALGMPDNPGDIWEWYSDNASKLFDICPDGLITVKTDNAEYCVTIDMLPEVMKRKPVRKTKAIKSEATIYQEMFVALKKMSPKELKLRRDILKSALLHNRQYEDARDEFEVGDDMTELRYAKSRFENFCDVHDLSHIHYIRKELGLINENFA